MNLFFLFTHLIKVHQVKRCYDLWCMVYNIDCQLASLFFLPIYFMFFFSVFFFFFLFKFNTENVFYFYGTAIYYRVQCMHAARCMQNGKKSQSSVSTERRRKIILFVFMQNATIINAYYYNKCFSTRIRALRYMYKLSKTVVYYTKRVVNISRII